MLPGLWSQCDPFCQLELLLWSTAKLLPTTSCAAAHDGTLVVSLELGLPLQLRAPLPLPLSHPCALPFAL